MADTTDLLNHAFEKNPVDFADTFNQLMQQKAQDAVEAHRVTLAQSIYGGEETDSDDGIDDLDDLDDNDGDDVGEDEFEFSDDELEDLGDEDDLDLDLDDLDLDDLDLDDNEDFTDDQEDA